MPPEATEHGLDAVEIFDDLTPDERARLAAELDTLSFKRGEILVRQGETADALYIVVTGRFVVTLDGSRQPIAELGPGQPVGEIAFLAGGVRTATVTALRDSLVLRLGRAEFEELSAKSPSIWRTLTVTMARRVATANISREPPPDPRPRTVTLIRAGSSELPPAFIVGLTRAFRRGKYADTREKLAHWYMWRMIEPGLREYIPFLEELEEMLRRPVLVKSDPQLHHEKFDLA